MSTELISYLTQKYEETGLIVVQGSNDNTLERDEFNKIKDSVDALLSVEKNDPSMQNDGTKSPRTLQQNLNSTAVTTSPTHGAVANAPTLSPIQMKSGETTDDEYNTATESDNEDNDEEEDLNNMTVINKTMSEACKNIDSSVLVLKQTIEKSLGSKGNVETQLQALSSAQVDINKDIAGLKDIVDKVDQITTTQKQVKQDVADMKKTLSSVAKVVKEIKEMMNNKPPMHEKEKPEAKETETLTQSDPVSTPQTKTMPNPQTEADVIQPTKIPSDVNKDKPQSGANSNPQPTPIIPQPPQVQGEPLDLSTTTATAANTEDCNKPKLRVGPTRDNTTKLNSQTENLVLSDSLARDVDEMKLDPSGKTQVKTFGGYTTNAMARKVDQFPKSNNVKQVYAHVGFNDSSCVNPMTRTSVALLINGIKMKFPNATLILSAVLPTREGMTRGIDAFNEACSEVCFNKMVKHVNHSKSFLGKKNLYTAEESDQVHLGNEGTLVFTSLLRQSLGLDTSSKIPVEPVVKQPAKEESSSKAEVENKSSHPKETSNGNVHGIRIETRITRDSQENTSPSLVHTEQTKYELGNVFQAFAGPCHSREEARKFKCRVALEFPETCDANNHMTAYTFYDNERGMKVSKCEDDGERGAGPRMQFVMDKINMENCVVVVTRHYAGRMSVARWTAIQDQMCKVAIKLNYRIPSNLDILSFNKTVPYRTFDQRKPPTHQRMYSYQNNPIQPLLSMENRFQGSNVQNDGYNLRRSYDEFTENRSQDYVPQHNGYTQSQSHQRRSQYPYQPTGQTSYIPPQVQPQTSPYHQSYPYGNTQSAYYGTQSYNPNPWSPKHF